MAAAKSGETEYDVVIVGGGMVGLSLALLIVKALPEVRIALVEARSFDSIGSYQPSFDTRSTAVSSDSVGIFKAIGLWSSIAEHATAIKRVHVSDRGHFGTTSYSEAENNYQALGYVVENDWLGQILIEAAKNSSSVNIFAPAKVHGLELKSEGVRVAVHIDDMEILLNGNLLVVADGARSTLRQHLGVAIDSYDYRQTAVVANVEHQKPHLGSAFERFTGTGPLALLPLGERDDSRRSAIVWTMPGRDISQVRQYDNLAFLQRLQSTFGYRLGEFLHVGERHYYPLKRIVAREQVRSSVVLVGNAAHYLHPVAGQGFNLALRDCECLVGAMAKYHTQGYRIGDIRSLQRYLAMQQTDQWLTTMMGHGFNILFSDERFALQAFRNLGLVGLNIFPPLKKAFFDQMMGKFTKKLSFI